MKYIQFFEKKIIYRTEGIPYLIRWNLFGIGKDSSFCSLKLHNILVSDDACMHDHPWAYISIILKGGYRETTKMDNKKHSWSAPTVDEKSAMWTVTRWFGVGCILFRNAHWVHKLDIDKPTWTLVFTLNKIKSWGFYTPNGFINWKKYSKSRDC